MSAAAERWSLDTNILLYLVNPDSPQHGLAVSKVEEILRATGTAWLAAQVLYEFWVVTTRPAAVNGLGWTAAEAYDAITVFRRRFTILPEPEEVVVEWLRIVAAGSLKGKRVHDAHLLATLAVHGIERLLTFNPSDFPPHPSVSVQPLEP